jgi:hypothetical protein
MFDPPTVWDIHRFARDRLRSSGTVRQHGLNEPYRAWKKVLRMFRRPGSRPDRPAGWSSSPAGDARCVGKARRAQQVHTDFRPCTDLSEIDFYHRKTA